MTTPPDAVTLDDDELDDEPQASPDARSDAPSEAASGRTLGRLSPRGLPSSGWRVVAAKEFGDHILSVRLFILLGLLSLFAVGAIYSTAAYVGNNAQAASGAVGLFVLLFSHSDPNSQVPSFAALVGLLGPLLGIAFGFDAINGERSERTLPRLMSQPIHRDAVIIGKFVAGLAVMGLILGAITLIVAGVAFFVLGVVPSPDDVARLGAWFVVTLAYLGFWLAFAMLCSVAVRRAATSVLAAVALWIVLTIFASLLVGIFANYLSPVPANPTLDQQVANAELTDDLARISPGTLYTEATEYILDPTVQTVDIAAQVAQASNTGAVPSALPIGQSLALAWPQVVALLALTVVCFGLGYIGFMRQEVRA
ncbi:MAG TPA: ABC transporter permease [Candidatus Limnocylindrales bacterium]|nr:ABC transporter permease [Candidatus Limnocylindrales bacterium]